MLVRCASHVNGIELVGAVDREGHPDLRADCGDLAGVDATGIVLTDDLAAALQESDVLIDFTNHTCVLANIEAAVSAGKAVVSGTTGLTQSETASLKDLSASIPIVAAPNMSLGVNLLFAFVERAAAILGPDYSIEIDDTHHVHKKDAPSGTALRLGEKAAAGRQMDFPSVYEHDPEGKEKKRDLAKIIIRSHRRGEVVGDHTVSFKNSAENVEFTHHACSRDAFALGALQAAQWVAGQAPGLYSMQDVLGL